MSIVEVHDLHKRYGDTLAVDGVSFAVEAGEVFGILGPNGAGKTTTVECIAGLRVPDSGRVRVGGLDPLAEHAEVALLLGVQLQESRLQDKITVAEALELFSSFHDEPADWRRVAQQLGLGEVLTRRYAKLSGGQKQRLSIALALLGRPRVLVLDELTTGLDPQARRDTWSLVESLRDTGVTILLVTHVMEEAERLCDRVALIDAGRVVAIDSPAALVEAAAGRTRLVFTPSGPVDLVELGALPEVDEVHRDGTRLVVSGSPEVLGAVIAALSAHGVTAGRLRVEQSDLDEAYLALTEGTTQP